MSRNEMTARCVAGSASIASASRSLVSPATSASSGQATGLTAQWPGQRACSESRKRSASTAASGTRPGSCRAENGSVRPSRTARVLAMLVRIRKIHVLSDERPSKR